MDITEAGHIFAHFPHPMHLLASTTAYKPLKTEMAPSGHSFSQQPHATHSFDTIAIFFDALIISENVT